eukprot:1159546-Pelagomonas_calceolata.AAC.4
MRVDADAWAMLGHALMLQVLEWAEGACTGWGASSSDLSVEAGGAFVGRGVLNNLSTVMPVSFTVAHAAIRLPGKARPVMQASLVQCTAEAYIPP